MQSAKYVHKIKDAFFLAKRKSAHERMNSGEFAILPLSTMGKTFDDKGTLRLQQTLLDLQEKTRPNEFYSLQNTQGIQEIQKTHLMLNITDFSGNDISRIIGTWHLAFEDRADALDIGQYKGWIFQWMHIENDDVVNMGRELYPFTKEQHTCITTENDKSDMHYELYLRALNTKSSLHTRLIDSQNKRLSEDQQLNFNNLSPFAMMHCALLIQDQIDKSEEKKAMANALQLNAYIQTTIRAKNWLNYENEYVKKETQRMLNNIRLLKELYYPSSMISELSL